jgi:hypothetical protein
MAIKVEINNKLPLVNGIILALNRIRIVAKGSKTSDPSDPAVLNSLTLEDITTLISVLSIHERGIINSRIIVIFSFG